MTGTATEWDTLTLTQQINNMDKAFWGGPVIEDKKAERLVPRFDPVDKPAHYNNGGIEAIDYIKQQLGHDGFIAYCEGNVIKYGHRWRYKNGVEDLKKKRWYLDRMIEEVGKSK
jgi:hypothetical protein